MTLADALSRGQQNNLHALRLALAVAVVVSHAWPLAHGAGTPEPLEALTGRSLGGWAVGLFFFLSGLLIAGSAERQKAAGFWTARARRLLPGLAVALAVTLALAVATGGNPSTGEALAYLARGITLVSLEHRIPGAFENAALPGIVNGPLWSLSHEVVAYALCWGAVRLGLLRHRAGVAVVLAAALALWAAPGLPGRLALGMAAYGLRQRLVLSPRFALALALVAPLGWPLAIAALGHLTLIVAFRLPARALQADLSYGVYIYGWPVAQMLAHVLPGVTAPVLAAASLAAVLPFAWASWHLVESPALYRPARA